MEFLEAMESVLAAVTDAEPEAVVKSVAASIEGGGRTWRGEVANACRLLARSKMPVCKETAVSILSQLRAEERLHRDAFQTMRSHHEMLKQGRVDKTHYVAYAHASAVTGAKNWLNDAFKHISDVASRHFGLTDEDRRDFLARETRPAVRERRKAYFADNRRAMPKEEEDSHRLLLESAIKLPRWWRRAPLRMLDIGSCHHPFRDNLLFTTTALDLQPIHPEVWTCDFLEVLAEESFRLSTTLEQSAMVFRTDHVASSQSLQPSEEKGTPYPKKLAALPRNHFHVAVMSLMLSYLPRASERGWAVYKARSFLTTDGILIISEASSACGKHSSWFGRWTNAIESAGFSLATPWKFCFGKVWIGAFRADDCAEADRRVEPLPLYGETE